MRLRTLTIAAAMTAGVLAQALPAAANTFCYDLDVVVQGDVVVDEADCVEA